MEELISNIQQRLRDCEKDLKQLASNKADSPVTIIRKSAINYFAKLISNKTKRNHVNILEITAKTEIAENIIRANLTTSGPTGERAYKNVYRAMDVVKFLCDHWDMDYPIEYENERYRLAHLNRA